MINRKRMCEVYLASLIASSYATTSKDWASANDINCYGFARRLTYPDKHRIYYSPGMIYRLKFGQGSIVDKEVEPNFIHSCITRDNIALEQPCTRVSFNEIHEGDGQYYFGIAKYHMCPSQIEDPLLHSILKDVKDEEVTSYFWHFICRTPSGIWLHKPNWEQPAEEIEEWENFGKSFMFLNYNTAFGGLYVPSRCICFEDFFYRVENNYALH